MSAELDAKSSEQPSRLFTGVASRQLSAHYIGRIGYEDALALQRRLVQLRQEEKIGDTILFLEHPATITLGRGAKANNVLFSEEHLAQQGVALHEVGRGGDVTYHGPGQLVCYPIIGLSPDREDVRKFVGTLEETMIRLAADFGIEAERMKGFNGTWVHAGTELPKKIGAVGVRISRWTTMHGFAFNAFTNLEHFQLIVPCGLVGKGVTSVKQECDKDVGLIDLSKVAAQHFADAFIADVEWQQSSFEVFTSSLPSED